jgi:hypothetical protein
MEISAISIFDLSYTLLLTSLSEQQLSSLYSSLSPAREYFILSQLLYLRFRVVTTALKQLHINKNEYIALREREVEILFLKRKKVPIFSIFSNREVSKRVSRRVTSCPGLP